MFQNSYRNFGHLEMSNTREENDWKPWIRVLVYLIQFDKMPIACVAKTLNQTTETEKWRNCTESFLSAIDSSLASQKDLSLLIPQQHSDPVIREYLAAIRAELLRRTTKSQVERPTRVPTK